MSSLKKIKIEKLNIDIASSSARSAKSLQGIPDLIYADSVLDGINKAILRLNSRKRPGRLLRIRFFGHGCLIGKKEMAGILLGPLVGDATPNAIATSGNRLIGREQLLRLKPFVRIYSSFEFHQCNPPGKIGQREVQRFVRSIADLLDTQVFAGVGNQATGKNTLERFEGIRIRADGRAGKKPLLYFKNMEE